MSYIAKLGAQAMTNDMMANVPDDEREKALAWHEGFYTGLHEAGMLTDDEFDELI